MKTIHRYVLHDFMVTFWTTLMVFTFVMTIGVAFRITDLLAQGVSWSLILRVVVCGIPPALSFSIPMSVLTACLLLFGRLSADGEVTAMKACGLSLWQMVTPLLGVCLAIMGVCLLINTDLSPRSNHAQRRMVSNVGVDTPLKLLTAGQFIQSFEGFKIYIGRREGGMLHDLKIYELEDGEEKREVRAQRAHVRMSEDNKYLLLDLYDVKVDPWVGDKPGFFGEVPGFKIENAFASRSLRMRAEYMSMLQLWSRIRRPREYYPDVPEEEIPRRRMKLTVEMNKRLALSMACFSFAMLGIPLGMKTSRKESSVGVAISLVLVLVFYLFIILADSLSKTPAAQPHLIIWLPVVISLAFGARLIRRWQ